MSRYIDADLLKVYEDAPDHREIIDSIPTADVVEVKHGKWMPQMIPTGVSAFGVDEMTCEYESCSECGYSYWIGEEKLFCPHCGARMDGES